MPTGIHLQTVVNGEEHVIQSAEDAMQMNHPSAMNVWIMLIETNQKRASAIASAKKIGIAKMTAQDSTRTNVPATAPAAMDQPSMTASNALTTHIATTTDDASALITSAAVIASNTMDHAIIDVNLAVTDLRTMIVKPALIMQSGQSACMRRSTVNVKMDGQMRIVASGEESVATNVCSVPDPLRSIACIVPRMRSEFKESAHASLDGKAKITLKIA